MGPLAGRERHAWLRLRRIPFVHYPAARAAPGMAVSSSTNAGLPPHPYRAASIVVTAVILSQSAEIRWRYPQRPRVSPRFQSPGPLRLFRALRDASGATAWAGVVAKAASTL